MPTRFALPYQPPLQWQLLLDFFRQRSIDGLELVSDTHYARSFRSGQQVAWYRVSHLADKQALQVELYGDSTLKRSVRQLVTQQFDLACNPVAVSAALQQHPRLDTIVNKFPGLRVPGIIDEFEAVTRAIAGQQISVKAARTLLRRLCERCDLRLPEAESASAPALLFPDAPALLDTPLDGLGFTPKRSSWMQQITERYARGFTARSATLEESVRKLCELPGLGSWSAHYIAMRAFRERDAFPTADLGLLNALRNPEPPTGRQLQEMAAAWRPYRAYATVYLWQSLQNKAASS